jgi:flagellar hook-length control protein FliK
MISLSPLPLPVASPLLRPPMAVANLPDSLAGPVAACPSLDFAALIEAVPVVTALPASVTDDLSQEMASPEPLAQSFIEAPPLPALSNMPMPFVPLLTPASFAAAHREKEHVGAASASELRSTAITQISVSSGAIPDFKVATPVMSSPSPTIPDGTERQLDLAQEHAWCAQVARDIVASAKADAPLSFRLMPQHLGQLDVHLAPSDAGMQLVMKTSTEEARATIAAAQPRLIHDLRDQGLRIAETIVQTASLSPSTDSGTFGRQTPTRAPPMIETAAEPNQAEDTQSPTRPQGRFA